MGVGTLLVLANRRQVVAGGVMPTKPDATDNNDQMEDAGSHSAARRSARPSAPRKPENFVDTMWDLQTHITALLESTKRDPAVRVLLTSLPWLSNRSLVSFAAPPRKKYKAQQWEVEAVVDSRVMEEGGAYIRYANGIHYVGSFTRV